MEEEEATTTTTTTAVAPERFSRAEDRRRGGDENGNDTDDDDDDDGCAKDDRRRQLSSPPPPSLEGAAAASSSSSPSLLPSYKERRRIRNPDRKRHGARNQDKTKRFVRWLLDTFPDQLGQRRRCRDRRRRAQNQPRRDGDDIDDDDERRGTNGNNNGADDIDDEAAAAAAVLDVAGGKGELAARLCVCHGVPSVVLVDPRPSDPLRCFETVVLRQLPGKWQRRLKDRRDADPAFLKSLFEERFRQLEMYFDVDAATAAEPSTELSSAVERSSLIVGLHADGATEAVVDVALRCNKPFVVVPCCVFPSLFPERRVGVAVDTNYNGQEGEGIGGASATTGARATGDEANGEKTKNGDKDAGNGRRRGVEGGAAAAAAATTNDATTTTTAAATVPVRTYEQFCRYLLQKDPRLRMSVLPFEGRNIAIWWDGVS